MVPLTHYSFITCTQGIFKTIKDKEIEKEIKELEADTKKTKEPLLSSKEQRKTNERTRYFAKENVLSLKNTLFCKRACSFVCSFVVTWCASL